MSSNVIVVKGLSKEYKIQHEIKDPYKTLRDSLVGKFVNIFNFTKKKTQSEMFQAINNIDLSINKGEKVAIIGRNGAGKSTLLKLLSRITEPTHGEIRIKGRVASLLEVGTGFHPELTGRENIFLNGAVLGMTKKEIRAKFDDIVDFSGCEKFLDTPVKRYSSGMRVRLGFAVAAHLESEILIVDEVLAVGDAEFQQKCLGKMDEISKGEGRTILFVSHNMSAVKDLCDKGIVLNNGAVSYQGPIENAIGEYFNNISNVESHEGLLDLSKLNNTSSKSISIESMHLINDGVIASKISTDKEVSISVKLKVFDESIKTFTVNITLYSMLGELVTNLKETKTDVECGIYNVDFSYLNLFNPGNYKLNISLKNGKTLLARCLDLPLIVDGEVDKFSGAISVKSQNSVKKEG